MPVPSGIILIWHSTNASIPTGWSRETALDGKYPKAHGTGNPGDSGGANTHTHTGSHTHSMVAHQHTYVTGDSNEWTAGDYSGSSADGGSNNLCAKHTHESTTNTTTTVNGGGLQSTTTSWQAVNHEPPYYEVIFIKPSGSRASMAEGICAHFNGDSLPGDWDYCDGNNSTPDLRNKYLKGAATSGNAGTTGGATTHQHTVTHGHTASPHNHSGNTQNNTNPHGARQSNALLSTGEAAYVHQHLVNFADTTDAVSNYVKTDAGSGDTVEIAYKKMGVIRNSGGAMTLGMIGLWLGSLSAIPKGWVVCDGSNGTVDLRNKYVKIGVDLSENENTGGANTHNHSDISHTHTTTGTHIHAGSTGGALTNYERRGANGGAGIVRYYDTHPISSVQAVSATYNTANISADTVNHEPSYKIAAYVQLVRLEAGGIGSFFFN